MCKWWGPKLAFEVVQTCLLIHGHGAYSTTEMPFEQRLRDVLGLQIGDGTAQIMKLVIARQKAGRGTAAGEAGGWGRRSMGEPVALEIADGIAHVTFAEPDRGNPFDLAFCPTLSRVATECDENTVGPGRTDHRPRAVLHRRRRPEDDAADREALPRFIKDATVGLHSAISRFARMTRRWSSPRTHWSSAAGWRCPRPRTSASPRAPPGSTPPTPGSGCSATAAGRRSSPAGSGCAAPPGS